VPARSSLRVLLVLPAVTFSHHAGSHTSVCLVQAGARVTIVDDLSNSFIEVLNRLEKLLGPLYSRITFKEVRIMLESTFLCA
jgi:UDP-glucose 4-epimerase